MSVVLLWVLDFIAMPKNYIKAYLLRDTVAIFKISMHIGKTRAGLMKLF
jgi:hypothetical protein